jgi:hypothetical protein
MISQIPSRPESTEYVPYFEKYVNLVPEGDILAHLEQQIGATVDLLRDVSEPVAETRHAPYTWSVKEVVGHLIDSERVFGFRALCFARADRNELPGFDENDYMRHVRFDARPLGDLVGEFELVRRSHIHFFRGLDGEAWQRSGIANGHPVSVRSLAYIIAGHERHHVAILRERLSR